MAELTVLSIDESGIADLLASLVAANVAGDSVRQASGQFIIMDNADASSHTLTVAVPAAEVDCPGYGDVSLAARELIVAAGKYGIISIPPKYAVNGVVSWTYDDITSVKVGVLSNVF